MNPIINISFEDIFSTRYELEKDAEKLAPNLIDENAGMISLFRKKLSQHLLHSYDYFDKCLNLKSLMQFEVLVHHSSTPENNKNLAYFDIRKTITRNDSKYYFGFYLKTLYYYSHDFFTANEDISNRVYQLWIHELIHMFDYLNLRNYYESINKLEILINQNADTYGYQYPATNATSYLNLIHLLIKLRNEGIAQLYEKLSRTEQKCVDNLHKAKTIFDQLFYSVINNFSQYSNSRQNVIIQEKIKDFETICYEIGHFFVLFAIANSLCSSCSDLANKALLSLEKKDNLLSEKEIFQLIKESIHLDFGSYLYNLTNPFTSLPFRLITIDKLLDIVDITTRNLYENVFEIKHITNIIVATQNNNKALFINEMKDIVGCQMSEEEVNEEYFSLLNNWKDAGENYFGEFFIKLKLLFETWKNNKNTLLLWALTYVLDPVDLINDKILYFGFLDDMLVMDSAMYLAKSN